MPGEAGAGGPPSSPEAAATVGYGKEDVASHRWSCREKEGQSRSGREVSIPEHGEAGGQEEKVSELALCSRRAKAIIKSPPSQGRVVKENLSLRPGFTLEAQPMALDPGLRGPWG